MAREFKTLYKIGGDSSGGVNASKQMRGELDKLNTEIGKQTKIGSLASGSIGQYAAKIAGVAAVATAAIGGIGAFAKAIADEGDRVQKLGIQLGVSTEFLSGMKHAAELSGATFELFTTSLQKSQRSIADLSAGLSTQVRDFDRLGLAYKDLKDLSPEDQFLTIAERLGGLEDKTIRVGVAMSIFGRAGRELIPLFAEGREGIQKMRDEAERLGLVMSQEFADAAAQFNDDLTRSQGVVTGIKRQIGEGLIPELDALAQQFVESAGSTDTWKDVGQFLGNLVRVLVAGFTILKEVVVLTAQAVWSAGKIIVDTLAAIVAPLFEFSKTLAASFAALTRGDFSAAADAFTGLGDRMAAAFTDNFSLIKVRMKEFGQDSSARLTKAVGTVNDILTRQAVVSQDAAEGMRELGEDTTAAGKKASKAAKEFETLIDKLDPLGKLGRQFTVDQAILAGKIAEGGDGLAYYTQLLEILKTQYAEAAREAVGFGEKAGAAAEKAAARAAAAAKKEADARAESLAKQVADQDTFGIAFRRGIERLDDLGADLWKGWFTGAKNAMQSIKDYFLNWLAELANAAITRPILVSITAALGLGGTGAAAASGIPGIGGIPGLGGIPGVGSGSGLGGIGGIASLFTGNGIGAAFAGLPSWLGGSAAANLGPTYGISQGGLFGNAANVSNLAYGVAGIVAGVLGQKIFGGYGGIGASLGATIGTAILPGIGTVIGGLLGGALGGLLGPKNNPPKLSAAGTAAAAQSPYASGHDLQFQTAFGDVFLRSKRIADEDIATLQSSITDFDATLAQFMTQDQIAEASGRLKIWSTQMEGAAISLEDLLKGRFGIVLSTFSEDIQAYVNEVADIGDQVQRLAIASTAQQIIDAAPDLFKGKTFREFIAVAESMQQSGEDLTATFQRLAEEVVQIANQLELVKGFANSNIAEDFDNLVKQQGYTLLDLTTGLGDSIRDLAANFTGSEDDLQRLSVLVSQRYDSEIAYLAQIKQISDGISAGFQSTKDQIEQDLLGPEAYYQKITGQAEELAQKLKTLTDPSQIAQTVAEIQRLTGQAYSLLDEQGKKANGQGFLDFISGVEADAQSALTVAKDLFIEESQVLRDLVSEMAQDFADPLEIAAAAHVSAASDLQDAASSISSAAAGLGNLGRGLVSAVGAGFDALVTAVNTSTPTTPAPTPVTSGGGSSGGAKNPSTLDSQTASSLQKVGAATIQAIQRMGSPNINVILAGKGMVTGPF